MSHLLSPSIPRVMSFLPQWVGSAGVYLNVQQHCPQVEVPADLVGVHTRTLHTYAQAGLRRQPEEECKVSWTCVYHVL